MTSPVFCILREEFETWLFEICPVFEHPDVNSDVYFVPLSDHVRVRLETDLSLKNEDRGRRTGQCSMCLASRHTNRRLDSLLADGRKPHRIQRGESWKITWAKILELVMVDYDQHQMAIDQEAVVPFEDHRVEMEALIGALPWKEDEKLRYFLERLGKGEWLTLWQEEHIRGWDSRRRKGGLSFGVCIPSDKKQAALLAVAKLESCANRGGDDWLVKFCGDMIILIHNGRKLSTKQINKMTDECVKAGIVFPTVL